MRPSNGTFCERNLPQHTSVIGKRYDTLRPSNGIFCERNLPQHTSVIGKRYDTVRPSNAIFCERNLPQHTSVIGKRYDTVGPSKGIFARETYCLKHMIFVCISFVQPYLLPVRTDMDIVLCILQIYRTRTHTHSHYRTIGFISFTSFTVARVLS